VSIIDASVLTMFLVALVPLAPTEPVLTAFGALAATGHGNPVVLIVAAAIGCSVSDHILYGLGRFGGARVLDRVSRRRSANAAVEWLAHHSDHWGTPILIVARWLPAGGTVGAVLAGALRWKLARFTPTSLVGSTLWSSYVVMLGYLGGSLAGEPLTGVALSVGMATVVGVAISVIFQRNNRHKADQPVAEPRMVEAGV
jgi:membrane protein DedA with SNARE-associated domain